MSASAACHVLISGRVQGVGFRYFVARRAQELGLAGWVRNLADGQVEAAFAGSFADVEALTHACARGPSGARVDRVEVAPPVVEPLPRPFEIRH